MKLSIPETWQTTKLIELAIYVLGGDWGKDVDFESPDYTTALCIRGAEFRNWNEDKGSTASPRKIKNSSLANRVLKDGDILVEISGGGPDQPVGRTVLIDKATLTHAPKVPKICTNFVRLLRTADEIDSRFLNSFLTFFYASGEIRDYQAGSNNLRNLKFNDYLGIDIPIPPLIEQHRIVAKIEELFSELDKGIENLQTARAQLKVYRQALLKHAFEGKLTAQWRKENQDKLETANALLKRIQQERAQGTQQQLLEWEASCKRGSKPKALVILPPLTAEELAELAELPVGWGWFKVAHICDVVRGGSPRPAGDPKFYGGDIPFLKVADITTASTPYLNSFTFTITEAGLSKTRQIEPNTLLLSNSGATLGVPKICLISATMNDGVAAFLGLPREALLYHYYFWESKTEHLRNIDQGAAQPNLNTDLIKETYFPICSSSEQLAVTQKLDAALSEVEQLDQTIATSLQQAEALRQSILRKAFSGQLVPQDPHDEPASKLLARIKAERERKVAAAPKRKVKSL